MTPIYKAFMKDGTPFPSVAVNSSEQREMHEMTGKIHDKFNELGELMNRCMHLNKKEYFMELEHYQRAQDRDHQSLKSIQELHKYWHAKHISVGWPDHETNHTQPIDQCKSKSSTKMS